MKPRQAAKPFIIVFHPICRFVFSKTPHRQMFDMRNMANKQQIFTPLIVSNGTPLSPLYYIFEMRTAFVKRICWGEKVTICLFNGLSNRSIHWTCIRRFCFTPHVLPCPLRLTQQIPSVTVDPGAQENASRSYRLAVMLKGWTRCHTTYKRLPLYCNPWRKIWRLMSDFNLILTIIKHS